MSSDSPQSQPTGLRRTRKLKSDVLEFSFTNEAPTTSELPTETAKVPLTKEPEPQEPILDKVKSDDTTSDKTSVPTILKQEPSLRKETMKPAQPNPVPNINQFRANAERQAKEQSSMGTLLSGAAAILLGGVLLTAVLASFGGYVLWKQIQNQSVTVAQIDKKYNEEVVALADADEKQMDKLDALVKKHQEYVTASTTQIEELKAQLKTERARRDRETSSLQQRIRKLEEQRNLR